MRANQQPRYQPNPSLIVYKSYLDLKRDLLSEFCEDKLREGIHLLVTKGFVTQERPSNRWDRTKAYRFRPDLVQAALIACWTAGGLDVHGRKIGDARKHDLPEARTIGDGPLESAGRGPNVERCSYKNTALEITGNENTVLPGQNKNPSLSDHAMQLINGYQRRYTGYVEEDPYEDDYFDQREYTYWNQPSEE